jgi:hypothetical protein
MKPQRMKLWNKGVLLEIDADTNYFPGALGWLYRSNVGFYLAQIEGRNAA